MGGLYPLSPSPLGYATADYVLHIYVCVYDDRLTSVIKNFYKIKKRNHSGFFRRVPDTLNVICWQGSAN